MLRAARGNGCGSDESGYRRRPVLLRQGESLFVVIEIVPLDEPHYAVPKPGSLALIGRQTRMIGEVS